MAATGFFFLSVVKLFLFGFIMIWEELLSFFPRSGSTYIDARIGLFERLKLLSSQPWHGSEFSIRLLYICDY